MPKALPSCAKSSAGGTGFSSTSNCTTFPNTVKKAMAVLSRLDVDMCNVHAAGTVEMMKYALEGLTMGRHAALLIAVTQLTSTSEERMRQELLINASINDTIVNMRRTPCRGLDGVVCSPLEAGMVHEACGKSS